MSWCEARCLKGDHSPPEKSRCLVQAARSGNEEARERLFTLLAPIVREHADRLCSRDGNAQDIAQAALLLALEHLPELRRPERIAAWAKRIVTNAWLMERRNSKGRPVISGNPEDCPAAASAGESAADARRALHRVFESAAHLPDVLAETFRLRVVEGLSTRQTAALLGVSEEAVRTRLARARKQLRAASTGSARK
jgi:RNA polymerase sigma-70 factor (ECF subfamily)